MEEYRIFASLAIPYKINSDGYKYLLLKYERGIWTFPGGKKDDSDNSLEDCLIREIKEEIGLDIDKSSLESTGLVNKFTYGPENPSRKGIIGETHFWLLKLTGNEELGSWDKIVDYGWFESEKIVKLLPFPGEQKVFLEATKKFDLV